MLRAAAGVDYVGSGRCQGIRSRCKYGIGGRNPRNSSGTAESTCPHVHEGSPVPAFSGSFAWNGGAATTETQRIPHKPAARSVLDVGNLDL